MKENQRWNPEREDTSRRKDKKTRETGQGFEKGAWGKKGANISNCRTHVFRITDRNPKSFGKHQNCRETGLFVAILLGSKMIFENRPYSKQHHFYSVFG